MLKNPASIQYRPFRPMIFILYLTVHVVLIEISIDVFLDFPLKLTKSNKLRQHFEYLFRIFIRNFNRFLQFDFYTVRHKVYHEILINVFM